MPNAEPVDLTNCDREPIHVPGSIQPHGCLVACDAAARTVLRHSLNAPDMLGMSGPVNGETLDGMIGAAAAQALRDALDVVGENARPAMLFDVAVASGRRFDVAVHRFKGTAIVEFEQAGHVGEPLQLSRELVARLRGIADTETLIDQTARLVRSALGYDRVMVYRFEHDGAGKVVSEARRSDLESFLGQYFPASDIQQQARALYLRNTIRIISDAGCERIAIEPAIDSSGEPLDLSFAHLRSVSPIHCEYLRNMGVAASMSISVIVDGALWGLIACHHYAPRALPMAERVAAEIFGEFLSLTLQSLGQKRKLNTATNARAALDRFLRLASDVGDVDRLLRDNLRDFMRLVPCDGAGLWMNGTWSALGAAPPAAAVPALARFLASVSEGRVWATHQLPHRFSPASAYVDEAAGLLAIPLSQMPRDYMLLFRKELVRTLDWAGNPDKSYETGPLGDRLTPRKSFAIWKETVRGQSRPWSEADREFAEAARAATVEVVLRNTEMLAEERRKADVRQRMLNEELNHRVKNILAVIRSLVGRPVKEGRSLEEYVDLLRGRIQALAHAHDQVVRGDGGGSLSDLLAAELSPYQGQQGAVRCEGPGVGLDGRAFSVMALVLHELATNAAKYGALSARGGRLEVTWRLNDDGDCELTWQESGGPPVGQPDRAGFGTALIDRAVPYDLGGESSLDHAPGGVRARFVIPGRHVLATPAGEDDESGAAGESAERESRLNGDISILLVEDQMLIAMDVESLLESCGATRIVMVNSVSDALAKLAEAAPDVAILDVNLGDHTSIPVAEELARRGIPFVFATGYGDSSMIPSAFAAVPVVRKPYEGASLIAAIEAVQRAPDSEKS